MCERIPLHDHAGRVRAYAVVDAADFEALSRWRWCLDRGLYAMRKERRDGRLVTIRMHTQVMGFPGRHIDHENGDGLDNRRENLRVATQAANMQNRPRLNANNTSGYRGVTWDAQRGMWKAQVMVGGHNHNLGHFGDAERADQAAQAFRAEHMPYSAEAA